MSKYFVKPIRTKTMGVSPSGTPYWEHLIIGVFCNDEKILEYERQYHSFYETFLPFEYENKSYAVYSHDYEKTSIMELPSGEIIYDNDDSKFCPVEFYVKNEHIFIAGCVWGDDWSWKVCYLNFKEVLDGKGKVTDKFNYHVLPDLPLKDCIYFDDDKIRILTYRDYEL